MEGGFLPQREALGNRPCSSHRGTWPCLSLCSPTEAMRLVSRLCPVPNVVSRQPPFLRMPVTPSPRTLATQSLDPLLFPCRSATLCSLPSFFIFLFLFLLSLFNCIFLLRQNLHKIYNCFNQNNGMYVAEICMPTVGQRIRSINEMILFTRFSYFTWSGTILDSRL